MTWRVSASKKGQRSPPPLPMYERVVLKHVPTMVRRRYDRDLNIIDENQGKDEDEEAEDLDDTFDDYEEVEVEDDVHASLDTEYDPQTCKESFGGNNIESSSSSCSKDCEDGHNGAKDEDLVRYVEASVDCKSEGKGAEDAYINVHGEIQDMGDKHTKQEDDKSEGDNGIEDNRSLASDYKDGSVQDEVQGNQHVVNLDNQQGLCIESEGDGIKDLNGASYDADANLSDDTRDKEQGKSDESKTEKMTLSFGKDSPAPLPMYEPVLLKHVPTIVRRRYDKYVNKIDTNPDLSEEDVRSEDEDFLPSTTSSDVDGDSGGDETCTKAILNTKHDTQNHANDEDFQPNDKFGSSTNIQQSEEIKNEDGVENDQGSFSKDVEEEDDTARDVKLASDVDTSIKTEPEHCEQGLPMEDCKTEVGGTKDDDNLFAADIDEINNSVENEVKDNEHGNDGSKQGLCSKDVEVVEDDRATDMNLASDVDAGVENEAKHIEQGLHVEGCESEDGGAKDVNDVANYMVDESVKQEVLEKEHMKKHENLDNKQGLHKENCERGGDGSKNTNDIICNKNVSIQEEVWDKGHGHFGSKQDTRITLFRNLFNNLITPNLPSFPSISWRATRLIQVKWNPPPINFDKLNFDGLCNSSLVVMGIVILNSHGSIISTKTYNMIKPTTLIVAEAMAIHKGILQLGLCNEGDKQSIIVRSIYRDYQFPWNIQVLVDDFKHLRPKF